MPHTAAIVPFWPAWTRTLDEMVRRLARARSRWRKCSTLLESVTDPIATPFFPRWHDMVVVGRDPLPSPVQITIIERPESGLT